MNQLNEDVLVRIFQFIDPLTRRQFTTVCKIWDSAIRSLQQSLAFHTATNRQAADILSLRKALDRRRIVSLHCFVRRKKDFKVQRQVCGLLSRRLQRLHVVSGADTPPLPAKQLSRLSQLQDLILETTVDDLATGIAGLTTLALLVHCPNELVMDDVTIAPQPLLLPPGGGSLPQLHFLRLENVHVTAGAAAALAALTSLRRLELVLDMLSWQMRSSLSALHHLTLLNLSSSALLEEGDGQGEGGGAEQDPWIDLPLSHMSALRVLGLNCCGLTALPSQALALNTLRVLSVAGNGLVQLPAGRYLSQLQALEVSGNLLPEDPPPCLTDATALQLVGWREGSARRRGSCCYRPCLRPFGGGQAGKAAQDSLGDVVGGGGAQRVFGVWVWVGVWGVWQGLSPAAGLAEDPGKCVDAGVQELSRQLRVLWGPFRQLPQRA